MAGPAPLPPRTSITLVLSTEPAQTEEGVTKNNNQKKEVAELAA
jgi:hypothetical protein